MEKILSRIFADVIKNKTGYAKDWIERIKEKKNVCIWGAGQHGKNWANFLVDYGVNVSVFGDNDISKHKKSYYKGIDCVSMNELLKFTDACIVIAVKESKIIEQQLIKGGFRDIMIAPVDINLYQANLKCAKIAVNFSEMEKSILELLNICEDAISKEIVISIIRKWFDYDAPDIPYTSNQYFVDNLIKLDGNEAFVDIGAFTGDTIETFVNKTSGRFNSIYGFEMDEENFKKLKIYVGNMERELCNKIRLYNCGIWNSNGELSYSSNFETSKAVNGGEKKAKILTLDQALQNEAVTYIKMDIEGAEPQALEGAECLIKKHKPKLAICIYHEPEHIWQIPMQIKKMVPEYKIYIRHHSDNSSETVCYAIAK